MAYYSTKHVVFDGTSERVDMGDVLNFERTDSFSISFWCRFTSTDPMSIVSKAGAASSYKGWQIYVQSHVRFQLISDWTTSNQLDVRTTTTILDGNWHHVLVTYDGTSAPGGCHIYIDDTDETLTTVTDNLSTSITTANTLQFGDRSASSLPYVGALDDISIWDAELTSGEVTAVYNAGNPTDLTLLSTASNLVGWWKCGDGDTFPTLQDSGLKGSNLVAPDLSPSGNDGTPTNMESGDVSSDVAGGRASTFNGSDEYVTMGDVLGFDYDETFSISCWVKTTDTGSVIVSKREGGTTERGFSLSVSGTGEIGFAQVNDLGNTLYNYIYTDDAFNDGNWHHVVATWDGNDTPGAGGFTIYVDGAAVDTTVGSNTLGTNTIDTTAEFNVAGRTNGSALYAGTVDDVAVYSSELSQAEITAIYNSGTPNDLRDLSSAPDLVGYWRMGDWDTSPTIRDQALRGDTNISGSNDIPDGSVSANPGSTVNMAQANVALDVPRSDFCQYSTLLDGAAEFFSMGDVLDFDHNEPYSLSVWFKTSASASDYDILTKLDATPRGFGVSIKSTGAVVAYLLNSGTVGIDVVTTATGFNDGAWHHLCVVNTGGGAAANFKIYIDNTDEALTTVLDNLAGSTTVSAGPLNIGTRTGGTINEFDGNLCEVSIYNDDLTSGEVEEIYNAGLPGDLSTMASAGDMVGWWRCGTNDFVHEILRDRVWPGGAATPPTIPDCSKYGSQDGTMQNMDASDIIVDSAGGTFSTRCLEFNGTDEYLRTVHNARLDGVYRQFSVSIWVKTTATTGTLIAKASDTASNWDGWTLELVGGAPQLYLTPNSGSTAKRTLRSTTTINDGAWHHVCFSYRNIDASNYAFQMRIDDVAVSIAVDANYLISSGGIANTHTLNLAARGNAGYNFLAGRLDSASVFGFEMTTAQLTELYNSGAPLDLSTASTYGAAFGWWRCGDASGNDATPTLVDGLDKVGDAPGEGFFSRRSLEFNGVNEYVSVGNVSELDFDSTDSFTLSFWTRQVGTSWECGLYKLATDGYSFYVDANGTKFYAVLDGSGGALIVSMLNQELFSLYEWHHLCLTYDGSLTAGGVKFYLDGVEVPTTTSGTLSGAMTNAGSFQMGKDSSTNYLTGNMDNVGVHNRELAAAEVTELYGGGAPPNLLALGSAPNLVGYWTMGEGAYDGTMTLMDATNFVDGVPGDFSYASFLLDGSDEFVTMGNVLGFERTDPFTLSCWIKTTDTGQVTFMGKMGIGSLYPGYELYMDTSERLAFHLIHDAFNDDSIRVRGNATINDGLWKHVCVTYDGSSSASGVALYINGAAIPTTTEVDGLTDSILNSYNLCIGRRDGPATQYYAGYVDEALIHDVELTPAQVADLYAFGAPVDPTALNSWSDAVGYWRMGEASFDGTMTNMAADDIVEGDGPGWEWGSVFRGGDQRGFTLIQRPAQFPTQDRGRYPNGGTPEARNLDLIDIPALRAPLAGTREQNTNEPIPPGGGGSTITNYFRMRGVDDGTATYTTWTAVAEPDPNGLQATVGNTTPTLVGSITAGSGITLGHWQQES